MQGYSRLARYWLPAKYSNLGNQTTKNNKNHKTSLFHKPFAYPFQTVPTLDEDDATDVFVEDEGKPHSHETKAENDAKEITETYAYYPLHYDAYIEREEYVACGTQRISCPYIDTLAYFKQYVHPKTPAY